MSFNISTYSIKIYVNVYVSEAGIRVIDLQIKFFSQTYDIFKDGYDLYT